MTNLRLSIYVYIDIRVPDTTWVLYYRKLHVGEPISS